MTQDTPDVARMRQDYETTGLDESDLAGDWPSQFDVWLAAAVAAGLPEPNAMTLATADPAGRPSARTVLLKGYDHRGFVCFTNLGSRKATEALANPYASLVFGWLPLHRQVVVCGTVHELSRAEAGAYFAQRPRGAQLGAWASPQSRVLASRAELDRAYAEAADRFPDRVPVPAHWGGLRVVPDTVEFWQGRPNRLHDRLRFRRVGSQRSSTELSDRLASPAGGSEAVDGSGEVWVVERLAP